MLIVIAVLVYHLWAPQILYGNFQRIPIFPSASSGNTSIIITSPLFASPFIQFYHNQAPFFIWAQHLKLWGFRWSYPFSLLLFTTSSWYPYPCQRNLFIHTTNWTHPVLLNLNLLQYLKISERFPTSLYQHHSSRLDLISSYPWCMCTVFPLQQMPKI